MDFETFIKDRNQPVVFKNFINEWSARKWTLQHLAQYLKDTEIKCKIGPKFQGIFETQCLYLDITIDDFIEWCSSKSRPSNPLHQIDKDKYFCYLDYKYMVELFSDNEEILQSVDWGVFGLTDRYGNDSTIWIGSDGCTTPCHYDTYGFNLVSQISGRKKWYLFPPGDMESLYPTRIPYEESSVFSEVNITNTDFNRHPHFKNCHPYMVILEPGDVLYVPKHWWHYVQCLDTAISVNTWVEMEDDNETRVREAITRILISSLSSSNNDSNNSLVNPTEVCSRILHNSY
ncbi:hypothetical protein LOTGIDRAFT_127245 [Lottia gigantea]|uniref:JmjC domain-containing protein n=1 Tax=Lottia gigantea TaxID=225164 RepID=V4BFN1_LOTGI|nr:hypothetical protein LOTGIDRAFT_127245 [Lottia gigantea]ESO87769.1 hypothetical protein LOTGIDRAFT_127245 [Lottia gigantea]